MNTIKFMTAAALLTIACAAPAAHAGVKIHWEPAFPVTEAEYLRDQQKCHALTGPGRTLATATTDFAKGGLARVVQAVSEDGFKEGINFAYCMAHLGYRLTAQLVEIIP